MPSLIVFRSSVNTIIYPYTYPIRATDSRPLSHVRESFPSWDARSLEKTYRIYERCKQSRRYRTDVVKHTKCRFGRVEFGWEGVSFGRSSSKLTIFKMVIRSYAKVDERYEEAC
jgi:hypothetical protein